MLHRVDAMTDLSTGMMLGMGLVWVLLIIFLILGIAACIKYLRSDEDEAQTIIFSGGREGHLRDASLTPSGQ
jgi:hypothetical protein